MKIWDTLRSWFQRFVDRYIKFLVNKPYYVLTIFFCISVFLTVFVAIFHINDFSMDPRKGFESRGTEMSKYRLILNELTSMAEPMARLPFNSKFETKTLKKREISETFMSKTTENWDILVKSKPIEISASKNLWNDTEDFKSHLIISQSIDINMNSKNGTNQSSDISADLRAKNTTYSVQLDMIKGNASYLVQDHPSTITPIKVDYDEYGVAEQPTLEDITTGCEQYYSMGKFIPYETLEFLSKIIFEVESFDKLKTMHELCELDNLIMSIPNSQKFVTKLPFSFNLPNYAICLNSEMKNCSQLNQTSIDTLKDTVIECIHNPVRLSCTTEIAMQIQNYILQKPKTKKKIPPGKLFIGAILRVQFY